MSRHLGLLLAFVVIQGFAAATARDFGDRQTPAPTGRIIIKFAEESGLAVHDGALAPATPTAARVQALIDRAAPGFALERHFARPAAELAAERARAERRSGRPMPNLERYARLAARGAWTRAGLLAIVAELATDPAVQTAFLEPVAVPAALGFDAFTGAFTPPVVADARATWRTPDLTDLQGYLDPAPTGVDAEGVWGLPGGKGQAVRVIDIEGAWLWEHEDLPDPFFTAGGQFDDLGWRNHGTAVLGEIRGTANAYGVSGIAHEAEVGASGIAQQSVAEAIHAAAAALGEGDIFLIELHAPGPNANGSGQFGYVCMEYWLDNFEAIQLATANGRICCEAAGNGEQNLDDPVYQGLFDRNLRDSGAILCGATDGSSLYPAWFTNHGTRVDLHGWGFSVVTAGYGDLQGGEEREWYTSYFSGTSSASPIVTGSVACLQGLAKAAYGFPLSADLARRILVETGTPQQGAQSIGPRPDLTAAWALLQGEGLARIHGVVTDAQSGAPVAGARVRESYAGAAITTGAGGDYGLTVVAGTGSLACEEFFHFPRASIGYVAVPGDSVQVDLVLDPRPLVEVGGSVTRIDGVTPLAGVRVTALDLPGLAMLTGAQGDWSLPGFPGGEDRTYRFVFDGLPGYGARVRVVRVDGSQPQIGWCNAQLPDAHETFEGGPGGFTGDPIWEYGTPTAGGPAAGFSGLNCWGVGMHGNYGDGVLGALASPSYDFAWAQELQLSFHYWCETEAEYDGANLQILYDGNWRGLEPLGGYSSPHLGGLGFEPGWSGSTGGWRGAVFDLTPYISSDLALRVQFGSDGYVNGPGFWVDEIAFHTGDTFSAIDPPRARAADALQVLPTVTTAGAQILFSTPQDGPIDLAVIDAAGRRVRSLIASRSAPGALGASWDGRLEDGSLAPAGAYFLRLERGASRQTARVLVVR